MATPTEMLDLADARFVSLTTFRRSGAPVSTPVWCARDGDGLVVTTTAGSGKAKRIRNDPHVVLAACGPRGNVAAGAPHFDAHAEVAGSVEQEQRRTGLLKAKYGLQYRAFKLVAWVIEHVRRTPEEWIILRVSAPPA